MRNELEKYLPLLPQQAACIILLAAMLGAGLWMMLA